MRYCVLHVIYHMRIRTTASTIADARIDHLVKVLTARSFPRKHSPTHTLRKLLVIWTVIFWHLTNSLFFSNPLFNGFNIIYSVAKWKLHTGNLLFFSFSHWQSSNFISFVSISWYSPVKKSFPLLTGDELWFQLKITDTC